MLKTSLKSVAVAAALSSLVACAGKNPDVAGATESLGACVDAALAQHAGEIVKLEMKSESKEKMYEFDIQSADGTAWDIECKVATGEVTEVEEEVAKDSEKFTSLAKVSEETALETALAANAGELVETEYEIEPDGKASYEFDILEADNEEVKVEVDATTGEIVETSYEIYQIGQE